MSTQCVEKNISHNIGESGPFAMISKGFQWMGRYLKRRLQLRKDRRELQSLLTFSPERLKDIGLSKGDVQWAINLPLSQDASTELEVISRRVSR